jgi:hypothetical protein
VILLLAGLLALYSAGQGSTLWLGTDEFGFVAGPGSVDRWEDAFESAQVLRLLEGKAHIRANVRPLFHERFELADSCVHQHKSVLDEKALNLVVQRGIGAEAGGVVDLQEQGLQVLVEHDVESQQLKAQVRPAPGQRIVGGGHVRLSSQQGADNNVLDLQGEPLYVLALALEQPQQGAE